MKLGLIETISTHSAVDTEWASAGRAGLFPENILPGSGTALACSWVFFYHFGLNLTPQPFIHAVTYWSMYKCIIRGTIAIIILWLPDKPWPISKWSKGTMAVLAVSLRASYLRCSSQPISAGDQQQELQPLGLMCIFVSNHICHSLNTLRGQIKAHWYFMWPISCEHVANYTNFHMANVVWCGIRAVILLKCFISDIKINCTVVASCIIRCSSLQKML